MLIRKIRSFSKFKRRILLAATILVVLIVIAFTTNTFLFHKQRYYFGTITSTANNNLTITTKFNTERVIALTSDTKIIASGHSPSPELTIGQRVMVISFENENKEREAKLIRLFK